jgi:hypothetical protein
MDAVFGKKSVRDLMGYLLGCLFFTLAVIPVEASLVPSDKPEEEIEIQPGYKIKNVPGDGSCGYWAILLAKAAAERTPNEKNEPICVSRKDVLALWKRLSDRIAHTIFKKDKTDDEIKMVEEIDQLIRDKYGNNREMLCQEIEAGSVQLDSPLLLFLAPEIGCDIFVNWKGKMRDGSVTHRREHYVSGCSDAKKIEIDYSGDGSGGHYRAIIPVGIKVHFDREF